MTTSQPTTQAPETSARGIVRATWKQHGNPISGFEFFGTAVKLPSETGVQVAKVATDKQGITLKSANGRAIKGGAFGTATKFWAIVPADAPRQQAPAKGEPKAKAEKMAPVEITAAKGGDKTVTPIKGAIAKAIKASGKSIMAISREHGLNPSQMRRLSLDTVAKVDLVRAEVIAKALGVKLDSLFGEASDKAKATPKTPNPAGKGNRNAGTGSKSKASKAAEKTAADQAAREAAEAAEAEAAQQAAEGSQVEPTTETPAE